MKYVDEYRDIRLISQVAQLIRREATGEYSFMEVCGGHTASIHRFGINSLLPGNIRLISGPGCPVCVTSRRYIDTLISIARIEGVIITVFGDLMRVPGSFSSLEKEKALGADVRVVFSALDALQTARSETGRKVVFPGIGFETTAPGTAIALSKVAHEKIRNFFVCSAHKVMPPAMEAILNDGARIDGFICPGHVAAVTGASAFDFIPSRYHKGCVITGFEPLDILQSVLMLVKQVNTAMPEVEIQYSRAVTREGNRLAQGFMYSVFEHCDAEWRGLGLIPSGGLQLKQAFENLDAAKVFDVSPESIEDDKMCICGDILRGIKTPYDCPLFPEVCTPENPVGACMVSNEGACNTYFKYRKNE